jgi:RNA polymerase sigma-70 factor, ECF subfamily
MNLHNSDEVYPIIKESLHGRRRAQNRLYEIAFPYAMSIAMRYGSDRNDSLEIVNEAFAKVFTYLDKYDPTYSFAFWLRKIVINTAIDHYKAYNQNLGKVNFENEYFIEPETSDLIDKIDAEQLLEYIQSLSPMYRLVFSLFAIEGYSHREISQQLGISEGTSKSNYFKAKHQLKTRLIKAGLAPKKYANS